MGLRKGFGAVKRAKKEAEQSQSRMAGLRVRDLILKDGQEVIGWFIGGTDEPVGVPFHSVKFGGDNFTMLQCAKGFDDHEGCVPCYQVKHNDRRVGKPREQFVWNFVDTTWIHKRKNREKTAEAGFDRFDYFECESTDPKPNGKECETCKKQLALEKKGKTGVYTREHQGLRKAKFSPTAATALLGLHEKLQKKCECGGKTKVVKYVNGEDEEIPPDEFEDVETPEEWSPVFECSKCDDPRPGSIHDRPIAIRRTGSGKQTTYTFTDQPKVPMPKWITRIEALDLEKAMVPMSAEKQADVLKVDNPFDEFERASSKKRRKKKGKGGDEDDSEDYDEDEEQDDEEEDEEDPFDDEEEDEEADDEDDEE